MVSLGGKAFNGRQLFKWIYNKRIYQYDQMTDLSLRFRESLVKKTFIDGLKVEDKQQSKDGTRKYLFRLDDGKPVETVLIPDEKRKNTVCVSSQVGCALTCKFCATGTMGLLRDLTAGEIVGQLLYLRDELGNDIFNNIVFMGMGEPLNNFENLTEAIKIITHIDGLEISPKRITVSTSGITPKIIKLANANLKVGLAISLHAATQEKRIKIMPIAQTFKLDKLMESIRYFSDQNRTVVTFEYILFDGFNDEMEDIYALCRLVHGLKCKINVLAYNPVKGFDFKRPSDEKVNWFGKELSKRLPAVTVRKSRGRDIDAACGQLAVKNI